MKREYDGEPLDMSWQDIKDRPYKGKGETIDVTPGESGRVTTEGVPDILADGEPSTDTQTMLEMVNEFRTLDEDMLETMALDGLRRSVDEEVSMTLAAKAATFLLLERDGTLTPICEYFEENGKDNIVPFLDGLYANPQVA